jgi:hypothetical protein
MNADEFCQVCIEGDVNKVIATLKSDPSLANAFGRVHPKHREFMKNQGAEGGWSALHLAAHYGHLDVAKTLIEAKADLNARSDNKIGNTPLMAAVSANQIELVKFLLESGSNPHLKDKSKLNALQLAEANKNAKIAKLLQHYM